MSEYLLTMNDGGGFGVTEYQSRRVLIGDVETVRQRFIRALEKLGYTVVSDQPLVAKNSVKQSGLSSVNCFPSALGSPIKLAIGFRTANPNSTVATFDYSITNSVVTKGDRQTLEREIDALLALATARPPATVCVACGTNLTNDSRFCRACGAPSSMDAPAEVEVLRLTAEARASYQNIVGSVLTILAVLALALPLMIFARKGPKPGTILLIIGEIIGFCWLFYGMWRLHYTLNPQPSEKKQIGTNAAHVLASPDTAALPQLPAHNSVTEGTTELLPPPEREAVPINRQSRNTGPIN
jgi:hypothetical protein